MPPVWPALEPEAPALVVPPVAFGAWPSALQAERSRIGRGAKNRVTGVAERFVPTKRMSFPSVSLLLKNEINRAAGLRRISCVG
jgi:hypothetical protein